jgi:hypothetical protein
MQTNAATTKQKQHGKNDETTDKYFFSKYCEDNSKKVSHKLYSYYTRFIQQTVGKELLHIL